MLADDYGESADVYIPTGLSALELADSSTDSAKVGVWVRAFKLSRAMRGSPE